MLAYYEDPVLRVRGQEESHVLPVKSFTEERLVIRRSIRNAKTGQCDDELNLRFSVKRPAIMLYMYICTTCTLVLYTYFVYAL